MRDFAHRHIELIAAVTPQRPEHLTRKALRMDPQERSTPRQLIRSRIAQHDRERRLETAAAVRELALKR
jgi:hypothetical protein